MKISNLYELNPNNVYIITVKTQANNIEHKSMALQRLKTTLDQAGIRTVIMEDVEIDVQ